MSEYRAVCPVCGQYHTNTACPTKIGQELGQKHAEMMAVPVANAINKLLEDKDNQIDALRSDNERLREAQRWIPVSERLPEEHVMVLVLTMDSEILERQLDYDLSDLSIWHWCDSEFDYHLSGWLVTHWMPLPHPPEVKE